MQKIRKNWWTYIVIYELKNVSAWCHRSSQGISNYQVNNGGEECFYLFFVTKYTEVHFLPRFMLFAQSAQFICFLCNSIALVATASRNRFKSAVIDY